MTEMMKCGHSANANRVHEDGTRTPSCAICAGLTPDAEIVVRAPDLTDRMARCSYFGSKCRSKRDSSPSLAFFEWTPARDYDSFYCGCYGWD